MELQITESYSAKDGSTSLYVAKENVLPNYASWLVPHGAPYKDNFNLVLVRLIEVRLREKAMNNKAYEKSLKRNTSNMGTQEQYNDNDVTIVVHLWFSVFFVIITSQTYGGLDLFNRCKAFQ